MYRVVVVSWDLYRDTYRIVAILLPNFTHCGLWPWMAPTVSLNLVNIGLQSLWKSPVRGPRPAKHTSDQLTSFVWSCLKSGKIKPNSGSVGQKPKSFHSDWVWVMAWCLMESNHYMNHCRPASMRSCGIHLCIISPDQMANAVHCNVIPGWSSHEGLRINDDKSSLVVFGWGIHWPLGDVLILKVWNVNTFWEINSLYPRPTKLEGGYIGFTLSVRLSLWPSDTISMG